MVAAAGPFGLGPLELMLILAVLIMLFGASRLADVGGSLGKGIREFRKNIKDDEEEEKASTSAAAPSANASSSAPPTPASPQNGSGVTVSAIKCPNCEHLNPMGSRHCNNCGASIATPVS